MNKLKLLIVEDDEGLCRQYRWAFPEHHLFTAQTRQIACDIMARERPPVPSSTSGCRLTQTGQRKASLYCLRSLSSFRTLK